MKAKSAAFELIVDIGTALVFLSDKPKEGTFPIIVSSKDFDSSEEIIRLKI